MISTFGNNIISAFTGGSSVKAIYTYGEKVWPSEPVPPTGYYIRWTPSDVSGDFFGGKLEDYSGYYELSSNYIPTEGFRSVSITTVETNVVKLSTNAFRNCTSLQTASLPNCSVVGQSAFRYCTGLQSISLPECSAIDMSAFYGCINLKTVKLPKVLKISSYGFAECVVLSNITLPECTYIGDYAFRSAGAMTTEGWISYLSLGYSGDGYVQIESTAITNGKVKRLQVPCWKVSSYSDSLLLVPVYGSVTGYYYVSIPNLGFYSEYQGLAWSGFNQILPSSVKTNMTTLCTDVLTLDGYDGRAICNDCSQLVSVSLPYCRNIGSNSFENCVNLSDLFIPKIQYINGKAFKGCTSLTSFMLGSCWYLADQAFYGCSNLSMIMLGTAPYNSGICELSGSEVFKNCSNLAYIYVPSSLYSKYLSASGWSRYSDIIYSL